LLNLRATCWTT